MLKHLYISDRTYSVTIKQFQMGEEDKIDFKWLVEHREKSQYLNLHLYNYLDDHFDELKEDKEKRRLIKLLLGIAFSLWRSVILTEKGNKSEDVLKFGKEFFKKLVATNSIGFPQDESNQNWTVGYYLNNARYRLS
ncbi:MAG: hypothetical protein JKY52_11560, partial [Flavobacteriales bacterium]|nr:hypothetical protein [Flavobacteriales bacterium]